MLNADDQTHNTGGVFCSFFSFFFYLSKEHFFDSENGTGYLAWRIKTIQRGRAKERRASFDGRE